MLDQALLKRLKRLSDSDQKFIERDSYTWWCFLTKDEQFALLTLNIPEYILCKSFAVQTQTIINLYLITNR